MAASERRVPPGCCPGCLMEYETEPCALHRAADDLRTACQTALNIADDLAAGRLLPSSIDWLLVAADLRAAIAKTEER